MELAELARELDVDARTLRRAAADRAAGYPETPPPS